MNVLVIQFWFITDVSSLSSIRLIKYCNFHVFLFQFYTLRNLDAHTRIYNDNQLGLNDDKEFRMKTKQKTRIASTTREQKLQSFVVRDEDSNTNQPTDRPTFIQIIQLYHKVSFLSGQQQIPSPLYISEEIFEKKREENSWKNFFLSLPLLCLIRGIQMQWCNILQHEEWRMKGENSKKTKVAQILYKHW